MPFILKKSKLNFEFTHVWRAFYRHIHYFCFFSVTGQKTPTFQRRRFSFLCSKKVFFLCLFFEPCWGQVSSCPFYLFFLRVCNLILRSFSFSSKKQINPLSQTQRRVKKTFSLFTWDSRWKNLSFTSHSKFLQKKKKCFFPLFFVLLKQGTKFRSWPNFFLFFCLGLWRKRNVILFHPSSKASTQHCRLRDTKTFFFRLTKYSLSNVFFCLLTWMRKKNFSAKTNGKLWGNF